ncbi:MAG: 3-hydroxybutyryl-CoA dehydrogenase [Bacteroidetes bacterium]|nr:3-hydroxybutyryl-CoA dehydrogenase [Bacteroidota bacterium]
MIKTIGVCGAGTMGSGIAQVAAMAGYHAILFDVNAAMVQKGRESIEKWLVSKNHTDVLSRLDYTSDITACKADLIIEAIIEKPEAKQDLFRQLAEINGPTTILASNTSSLSLTALAETIPYPERFAGMHFFNPAPLMKLVEVVSTDRTGEDTLQILIDVAKQMGKTPVRCKDAPGFIVNHVARPYYLEAMRLVEEGLVDIEAVDQVMEATGFRMGPFRLMDLIGNDINYAVSCSVYEAMGRPQRLQPSPIQEAKVREGALGRKTGKGYYRYE